MGSTSRFAMVAAALFALGTSAFAQQPGKGPLQTGESARPRDAGANKPSESGAQSSMPAGAATGAGQPQGGGQPAEAQAAGSAKAKSQAKSGSGNAKLAKQTRAGKKSKRRAAKRAAEGSTDASATSAPGTR